VRAGFNPKAPPGSRRKTFQKEEKEFEIIPKGTDEIFGGFRIRIKIGSRGYFRHGLAFIKILGTLGNSYR